MGAGDSREVGGGGIVDAAPHARGLSVLHINHKNCVGGSALQMLRLARHQRRRGLRVTILTRPSTEWEKERCRGEVKIVYANLSGSFDLASVTRIARLVRKEGIDIIHAHKGADLALGLLASVRVPVGGVVVHRTVAFPLDRLNSWKYRLRRVDRIIAVSRAVKEELVQSGRIDPARVVVVHRGLELDRFEPAVPPAEGLAAEFGIPEGERVVGMIANVLRHKGHEVLLGAAARVVRRIPRTVFLLVGELTDADLMGRLRRRVKDLSLESRVRFTGFRNDISDIAKLFDVGVLASTSEGFPNVLLEQMAVARPVVATRVGGAPEIVADGETGILVPPGDPQALGDAIAQLLEHPELGREMGMRARRRVELEFSMEKQVRRIEDVYQEVLARRSWGRV